ncbi:MAG TPA: sugar phosphate nucleotidyltransferase [Candidatus Limnocylindrales bacterium]|jgi:mannose-1-phosphate guanylyltransferase|nr:sugar phosphate nucleotidyltransferase [Candidatus Limnocylindrales bacterium]
MYAVIMAGGGGTRLHPLSRPERPKPFLPLAGDETLLQATARRLPTTDVTVVTDRRYERFVREQLPDAHVLVEPMGRNTAAAIALATIAIDRPADEVMLVVPADAFIAHDSEGLYTSVLEKAEGLATDAFEIEEPLVTFGVQTSRPATQYGYLIPKLESKREVDGLVAYQLDRFEEKPTQERAEMLLKEPGVAWNAGIFLWRRSSITAALARFTGLLQSLRPMVASPTMLQSAYEAIQQPKSIDHAVMEGAAKSGRVVMGAMDVGWSDLGSWTALLSANDARGEGAVVQAGETVEVGDDDLVVRRVDGRLGVIAPPERGSMTAAQPIAVLRGAAPDREKVEALIERCARAGG